MISTSWEIFRLRPRLQPAHVSTCNFSGACCTGTRSFPARRPTLHRVLVLSAFVPQVHRSDVSPLLSHRVHRIPKPPSMQTAGTRMCILRIPCSGACMWCRPQIIVQDGSDTMATCGGHSQRSELRDQTVKTTTRLSACSTRRGTTTRLAARSR